MNEKTMGPRGGRGSGRAWLWAVLAAVAAIAASPLAQHFTGSALAFSLAPAGVALVVVALARPGRAWLGLTAPSAAGLGLAWLAPAVVMLGCAGLAAAVDGLNAQMPPMGQLLQMAAMSFAVTFVLALITEDGFFRGALWALCRKAGGGARAALVFTSVAFALWHAAATRLPGFELPLAVVPVYLLNMALVGLMFGLLRQISGSLVAPAMAHALWNTLAYGFFGQGTSPGLLGIERYWIFDPERGWAGCAVTAAVVGALYAMTRRPSSR